MKRFTLFTAVMFFFLSSASAVYAAIGPSDCDSDAVHCAELTGTSSPSEAHYIKFDWAGYPDVECFANGDMFEIVQAYAGEAIGNNQWTFSICKSQAGTDCQQIGVDNFTISGTDGNYTAVPAYYDIDLSRVQNQDQFPTCQERLRHRKIVIK